MAGGVGHLSDATAYGRAAVPVHSETGLNGWSYIGPDFVELEGAETYTAALADELPPDARVWHASYLWAAEALHEAMDERIIELEEKLRQAGVPDPSN